MKYVVTSTLVQPSKFRHWFQFVVAFSATLYTLAASVVFGWTSPSLPKLMQDDSPVLITADEGSWIVSLMKIGVILAPLPSGWLMEVVGRKNTLLIGVLPLILAWILVGVAESVWVLYVSRLLGGFSFGLAYVVTPMYLGEIAIDNVRGAVGTLLTVMGKTGILYAVSIGPYVPVRTMAWLSLIPILLFLVTFIWLPESPYYYLGQNRKDLAFKSLSKLRGTTDIKAELEMMDAAVTKSKENKGTFREIFFTVGNRRGLIILIGLAAIQQLSGSQAIISYSEMIFNKVGSKLAGSEASIILAAVQIGSAAVASFVVDTVGRRSLLLISVGGVAVCNTIIGTYFNLERNGIDIESISWVPMAALMIFMVCYTIGMATATFVLLGEICPKNLKAIMSSVYITTSGLFAFAITKLFQVTSDGLGSDYSFFGFAIFSYLFVPFVWFLVPETKGKSLDAILIEMNGRI